MTTHAIDVIVAIGLGMLYAALAVYLRREKVRLAKSNHDFWWRRRKADRDDLVDSAMRATRAGLFRAQRDCEDAWTYASQFREYLDSEAGEPPNHSWTMTTQGPRLPLLRRSRDMNQSTWTTIQTFWFSVDVDGVVHRGARLLHDKLETPVLLCNPDLRVPPAEMLMHLEGTGPLVTCMRCVGLKP